MNVTPTNTKCLFDFQAHLKNEYILSFDQPLLEAEYMGNKEFIMIKHIQLMTDGVIFD